MNQHVATPSFHSYGGTAPENYERYFVPAIGLPLATELVETATPAPRGAGARHGVRHRCRRQAGG